MDAIVSKYIGETEKNLSKLFGNAEFYSLMLLFDEADAFVGKGSEMKDAHDRFTAGGGHRRNYIM